jgi:DNA-binding NarL/FixJ family response regulator
VAVVRDMSVLLVSDRPAIGAFVRALASPGDGTEVVGPVPVSGRTLPSWREALDGLAAAIVDVGSDPTAAIEICRELGGLWRDIRTIALVCCPHALTIWQLQALATSCDSVLDLHSVEEELRRALRSAARGHSVFHIDLGRDGGSFREGIASGPRAHSGPRAGRGAAETEVKVIDLIARGMSDREMARHLHLSPHTIGHYVDRLCSRIGVKNRVALAAWAGRHGFYHPQQPAGGSP